MLIQFYESSNSDRRGLHLINWATVSSPKCYVGLGICKARLANMPSSQVGLARCEWTNRPSSQVLAAKYLQGNSRFSVRVSNWSSSYLWKDILKTLAVMREGYKFCMGRGWDFTLVWLLVTSGKALQSVFFII